MASSPFLPMGVSSIGIAATAASSAATAMPNPTAPAIVVTNEATTNAWITWGLTNAIVAAFPTATPQFGMEVVAGAQVSIGTNGQAAFVAVILRGAGTGNVVITAGDGV